jgi:hypothetical protein
LLDIDVGLAECIKASHHILEHIEAVSFSGLAKQPVFSAYHERLNRALSAIIINAQ